MSNSCSSVRYVRPGPASFAGSLLIGSGLVGSSVHSDPVVRHFESIEEHDGGLASKRLSAQESDVQKFHRLAARWRAETENMSSLSAIAMHPAYQAIIGLGSAALPLILQELQRSPDQWFWALKAISGQDPVPPSARGSVSEMTRYWMDWGRQKGFVSNASA